MMRLLFASILALTGCQTSNMRPAIESLNKKELRGYFTQNFQSLPWSSKARSQALGGGRVPPPPVKVQILDTREPEVARADHWQQEKRLKSKITPLYWKELMDEHQQPLSDVKSKLENAGLEKYELLVILSDSAERARRLAEITLQAGYSKTKYYDSSYLGISDIFKE